MTRPVAERRAQSAAVALEAAKAMTFDQCAAAYIKSHSAGWRNEKHAAQWETTLATYASPVMGKLPVAAVDVGLVLKVLEPIWKPKNVTASRLRAASSPFSIGPRCASIGTARTRPGGAAIWTSCCPRRCAMSNITLHCPTPKCLHSWRACAIRKALQPAWAAYCESASESADASGADQTLAAAQG